MKTNPAFLPALAMVAALGLARTGHGQPVAPPDLNNLVHQMAERVRHLGEDIDSDLGQTPAGKHLAQDTQELAQAVDEFHEALHDNRDPTRVRQAFAGIDGTWQHLRAQLTRPGVSSPAVDRAAGHVDQLAAQIRQAWASTPPHRASTAPGRRRPGSMIRGGWHTRWWNGPMRWRPRSRRVWPTIPTGPP